MKHAFSYVTVAQQEHIITQSYFANKKEEDSFMRHLRQQLDRKYPICLLFILLFIYIFKYICV